MVLTIDAGNTNTAVGIFHDGLLIHHWRLSSRTQRTADEFALHLRELARTNGPDPKQIDRAVVCSVVPALTRAVVQGAASAFSVSPLLVNAHARLPVTIATDNPLNLGGDLIANAVGGYQRVGGACIVVDFGTALTFTAVDGAACVRGAAIAPGLSTAVHGLVARTAALPMVELARPSSFIGTNTRDALRSGIMNGYSGLVDRMIAGIRAELPHPASVLVTGGESAEIAELCDTEVEVAPWLTLEGLFHIAVGTMFTKPGADPQST